jgi:hypothetical protein
VVLEVALELATLAEPALVLLGLQGKDSAVAVESTEMVTPLT